MLANNIYFETSLISNMTYGELLNDIPQFLREIIRNLEKEIRKLFKTEWSAVLSLSLLSTEFYKRNKVSSEFRDF